MTAYQPRRRSWARTLIVLVFAVIGAGFIAVAVLRSLPGTDGYRPPTLSPASTDYRDPLQLGTAVKEHYHADTAGCSKLSTGTYTCFAFKDGASAAYTVTVAPDGESWSAG